MALAHAVADPIKAHVDCLGSFLSSAAEAEVAEQRWPEFHHNKRHPGLKKSETPSKPPAREKWRVEGAGRGLAGPEKEGDRTLEIPAGALAVVEASCATVQAPPQPFRVPPQLPPPPELTDVFGFTPFGIYCRVCNERVGSSDQMIKLHFEKKHGRVSPETVQAFKTIADAEVHRLATEGNLQSYILSQCDGLVCGCGVVFTEAGDRKAL